LIHVVLVGLRPAFSGRPDLLGAGALNHCCDCALEAEPFKDDLRQTEQHDLGQIHFCVCDAETFLAFSQFLYHLSGNLPEGIPWYLDRIMGGIGVIVTLDFIFHWLIPFTLLLSRDLKRYKKRWSGSAVDGLRQGLRSLLAELSPISRSGAPAFTWGILEYAAVPVGDDCFFGSPIFARS